jgi:hypothetical protein
MGIAARGVPPRLKRAGFSLPTLRKAKPLRLRILDDPAKGTVNIPVSAARVLIAMLEEIARICRMSRELP